MAFYVKMSTAPGECAREAMRQGIGVSTAVLLGYIVPKHDPDLPSPVAKAWLQSWKWAAITVAVVTSPVIGKVAKVSFERFLGTIVGGILAYIAARFGRDVIPLPDEIVCTVATLLAASGAQLIGQRAGSAYAAKLSTITFLLVLLGSKDAPNAFAVMLSRICGILGGVLISLFLSVLIFPTSASQKATSGLDEGLQALTQLCRMAWGQEGKAAQAPDDSVDGLDGYQALPDSDEERGKGPSSSQGDKEAHREEVLHNVYSKLSKCQDNLPLALNEVYVCTVAGRWFFLPSIPGMRSKSWAFPNDEMDQAATALRQVARMLWGVHVTLQMGFEEEFSVNTLGMSPWPSWLVYSVGGYRSLAQLLAAVRPKSCLARPAFVSITVLRLLRRHYPPHIMPDLQRYSQAALHDLTTAFPHSTSLDHTNLNHFLKTVEELTRIASERRSTKQRLLNSLSAEQRGEYTNLSEKSPDQNGDFSAQAKQEEDDKDPDAASRGDAQALDGATQEGLDNQPKLAFFPATHTGYTAKVRWYSFQFSMQQLAEELKEAFAAVSNVLTRLPASTVHHHYSSVLTSPTD